MRAHTYVAEKGIGAINLSPHTTIPTDKLALDEISSAQEYFWHLLLGMCVRSESTGGSTQTTPTNGERRGGAFPEQ